jgi:biotin operon repressor
MPPPRRYPHDEIVRAHLAGATRQALRETYGVSAETVRKIIRKAGIKSWREGDIKPPYRACHPVIDQLFRAAHEQRWSYHRLADRTGVSRTALASRIRQGRQPGLLLVVYVAEALGYELVLRKKDNA